MSRFYSQDDYMAALDTSLLDYLQQQGMSFRREGRWWRSREHDSLVIDNRNRWHWNSRDLHGYTSISYLVHVEGMTYPDAVYRLLGHDYAPVSPGVVYNVPTPNLRLELPAPYADNRRVWAYLTRKRGIEPVVLQAFIDAGQIYESDEHHNLVFAAYNAAGQPRHCSMRSTYTYGRTYWYEHPACSTDYPFSWTGATGNNTVYVCEAQIDMLSQASLACLGGQPWEDYHYVSIGGACKRSIYPYLARHPQLQHVYVCLDNDQAGHQNAAVIMHDLRARGYDVHRVVPHHKDINDDLASFHNFLADQELLHECEACL